jgi:Xaa-Pro aminopeptidase
MQNNLNLDQKTISQNIKSFKDFMQKEGLDAFYISSFNEYISEYTPLEDCHRYYFSGFSGSTAEVLITNKKVRLYVDGRYWEQADNEVNPKEVEVVRATELNTKHIKDDIIALGFKNVGVEAERTTYSYGKDLENITNVKYYSTDKLEKVVPFAPYEIQNEIELIEKKYRGSDTKDKLKRVLAAKSDAYFTSATDSVSWITNCRGYHLPYQSSFLGKALITSSKVYVFIPPQVKVSEKANSQKDLEFIPLKSHEIQAKLKDIQGDIKIQNLLMDKRQLNSADYLMLERVFPNLIQTDGSIYQFQSRKEQAELDEMMRGFELGNKAIYNTIKWVKENVKSGNTISELDLFKQTTIEYEKTGSREQSFNTIAGVGANSSIIHYGSPSDDIKIKKDDWILLDSGGYYDGGFATDTTRTFLADESVKTDPKFIKFYTTVLKGLLRLQNATFPVGISGSVIDGITREPLYAQGMEFKHGTGHGVGIHVHEPGVRISTVSNVPMAAGQVVSLEPGFYEPGFGGVRLENIAIVEEHPDYEGFLRFKNMVWIGFEPALIDESLLNTQEKTWLDEYEAECSKRGTSFR